MITNLQQVVNESNPKVLGQILLSKKYKELYDWVLNETKNLNRPTIKERVKYLLLGKPNLICINGQVKKFVSKIQEYGFCGNTKNCKCFREQMSSQSIGRDMENVVTKRKITWLNKYGVENVSQCDIIKRKRKDTMSKKDYSKIYLQMRENKESAGFEQVIDRLKEIVTPCFSRDEYIGSFRKNFYRWKCNSCSNEFNDHVDYGREPRCLKCYPANVSTGELELRDWIKSLGLEVIENDRIILSNLELDILLPSKKIAIEFNGTYWHSDKFKDQVYHINKYLQCKEKGIHLIQIFEDEWISKKDIIKSRLKSLLELNERIYARKCQIRKVSSQMYKQFVIKNHLQGYASASVTYGLYFEEKLVAIMSFSKSRYNKDGYELIRYCSIGNIVGGASKLFLAFITEFNPIAVTSYANRCWSNGNLYQQLGFVDVTKNQFNTGYWYFKNDKRYHRSSFTKKRLVKMGYDPIKTEDTIMKEEGYLKMYDCGNYKFRWEPKLLF